MWDGVAVSAGEETEHLAATADRLRAVRRAHERFLALWAVDHLLADLLNDVAAQMAAADTAGTPDNPVVRTGVNRPVFRKRLLDD